MKEEEEDVVVEPISREVTEVPVKTESNGGETPPKPNLASTLRCNNRPSGCGRSRQNLSEVRFFLVRGFVVFLFFFF